MSRASRPFCSLRGHEVKIIKMPLFLFLTFEDDQNEWSNVPKSQCLGLRGRFVASEVTRSKNSTDELFSEFQDNSNGVSNIPIGRLVGQSISHHHSFLDFPRAPLCSALGKSRNSCNPTADNKALHNTPGIYSYV